MKKTFLAITILAAFAGQAVAQQVTPAAKTETTKETKHSKKKKKHTRENGTADAQTQPTNVTKGATNTQQPTPKKVAPTY